MKQPMISRFLTFSLLFAALCISPAARGGMVTPIGPFQGALSDDFNSYNIFAYQQLSIMGGAATVSNLTPGGALKIEFSSSLGGRLVVSHSPPRMLGQLGISEWDFDQPLADFGGYFANNSRFDDARVDFFDGNGALIDSVTATVPIAQSSQDWHWNGWHSDVPIKRFVVTGNDTGFANGFIWFDDVQANQSPVPEPSSLCLAWSGLVAMLVCCGKVLRPRNRAAHRAREVFPSALP
jgi:hypothetical protein